MKCLVFFLMCLLSGCAEKAFELEEMSKDVLKSKQGVDIQIKPLPKE